MLMRMAAFPWTEVAEFFPEPPEAAHHSETLCALHLPGERHFCAFRQNSSAEIPRDRAGRSDLGRLTALPKEASRRPFS
jgi:hypothetical protein